MLSVRDLSAAFFTRRGVVLGIILSAGLVSQRQQGRTRIYRLEATQLQEVFDWVRHYEKFWDLKLDQLGRYLDRRKRNKQ